MYEADQNNKNGSGLPQDDILHSEPLPPQGETGAPLPDGNTPTEALREEATLTPADESAAPCGQMPLAGAAPALREGGFCPGLESEAALLLAEAQPQAGWKAPAGPDSAPDVGYPAAWQMDARRYYAAEPGQAHEEAAGFAAGTAGEGPALETGEKGLWQGQGVPAEREVPQLGQQPIQAEGEPQVYAPPEAAAHGEAFANTAGGNAGGRPAPPYSPPPAPSRAEEGESGWNAPPLAQPLAPYQREEEGTGGKTPPKARRKRHAGLRVAALLLACALFGFGGGAGAVALLGSGGSGTTVVYQAPQAAASPTGALSEQPLSVSDVAALAGQSVVSVLAESRDPAAEGGILAAAGSGVVLSEDGYILTNHHVVEGAEDVLATLSDGREYHAEIVGSDARSDVALLKIEAEDLTPAVLGNSDNLRVGDFSMAIGNPQGVLEGSVSTGIISALERYITIGNYTMKLIQTSAPVSPGNSGGGLFNNRGELVGIVSAKSGGENTEGLGFAIPINDVMDVVEQLLDKGYVTGRPGMGVTVMAVRTQLEAEQAGVAEPGLYVAELAPGGAAEKAGLRPGDRLLSIDGEETGNLAELRAALEEKTVGQEVAIEIVRGNRTLTVYLVLEELGG